MRIEVHVKSIDEIERARIDANAVAVEGDEIVVIVAQPVARVTVPQARKPIR